MDGTTSGPIFLLVRRANAADFMYSNFVSVSSRRLDGRVFYAFTSVHYLVHTLKNGLLFFFFSFLFFLHLLVVIIVTCSWGFPIPVIAVSVFLVAGLVSVPLLSPCSFREEQKNTNLSRMRFKSYFVTLVLSNFSDSLDYVELKGEGETGLGWCTTPSPFRKC